MDRNHNFSQKQKKRQRMKNGPAIGAALLLLLFVFVAAQYLEKNYTEDAASGNLTNLKQESFVTLVSSGKTLWEYWDDGAAPPRDSDGNSWKEGGYDSTEWKSGKGTFGSEGGKRTTKVEGRLPVNLLNHSTENGLSVPVYYYRTEFNLDYAGKNLILNGTVQFDDSIVIYLNGKKIHSDNIPLAGFDSDGYGAEVRVRDSLTVNFTAEDLTMLKKGRNVLAVEVHQADYNSSDVYFDFKSLRCQAVRSDTDLINAPGVILQPGDTQDSVIINLLTEKEGEYKLQFAKKADFMKREIYQDKEMRIVDPKGESIYCYTAAIDNLQPGEEYVYRIARAADGKTSVQFEYTCRNAEDSFSFLLVGDPQIGAGSSKDDTAGWQETLEAGSSIDFHNASFIISAGDQVDSADEEAAAKEYFAFRSPQVLRSLPVAVVRGNHETDNDLYDMQFQRENQNDIHDYSFTYGETLFVHINSNNDEFQKHRAYLEAAIEKNDPEWIVVMTHYSLYGCGPHSNDEEVLKARSYYSKCFKDLNVDLVVSGHDHLYARSYLMNGNKSTGKDGGKKRNGETMYLTGNSSSGSKFGSRNARKCNYLAELNQEQTSFATSIKISRNEMTITTYDIGDLTQIDYCKIKK